MGTVASWEHTVNEVKCCFWEHFEKYIALRRSNNIFIIILNKYTICKLKAHERFSPPRCGIEVITQASPRGHHGNLALWTLRWMQYLGTWAPPQSLLGCSLGRRASALAQLLREAHRDPEMAKLIQLPAAEWGNTTAQEAELYGKPTVTLESDVKTYLHVLGTGPYELGGKYRGWTAPAFRMLVILLKK